MNSKLAVVATAFAALALTGCGGQDDEGAAAPAPTTPASPTATPTPGPADTPPPATAGTPTPAPSSTPPPKPTAPPTKPLPKAADGTNYKACADSRCEVTVRTGTRLPVKRSTLGFTSTLKIDRVSDGTVAYSAKGGCCSLSTSAQGPGKSYILNSLKVTTVSVTGNTAVLSLKPA